MDVLSSLSMAAEPARDRPRAKGAATALLERCPRAARRGGLGVRSAVLDMRAGFDAPADGIGDEELSAIAAVWRDARAVVALALGVDAHRVGITLDLE
jgi:hypothetical protein